MTDDNPFDNDEAPLEQALGGGTRQFARASAPARPGGAVIDVVSNATAPSIEVRTVLAHGLLEGRDAATVLDTRSLPVEFEHPRLIRATSDAAPHLLARLRRGAGLATLPPPAPEETATRAKLALAIARRLGEAHAHGIVHRDLQPDRILIDDDGEVTVLGWQASVLHAVDVALAVGAAPSAVPPWQPPEAATGHGGDMRGDVWALGALAYHLLCGRPPLAADDAQLARRATRGEHDPAPLAALPAALAAVVRKALAPNPLDRHPDARALADDLAAWLSGDATSAEGPGRRAQRWLRRHGPAAALVAGLAVLAIILAAALHTERARSRSAFGEPLLAEGWDAHWRERWLVGGGTSFDAREGAEPGQRRLVSTALGPSVAWLRQRLDGPTVVEFTGEILADARPGDLSLLYALKDPLRHTWASGWPFCPTWRVQVGAFDNRYATINTDHERAADGRPFMQVLALVDYRLQPGRSHRIRIEIGGPVVRLLVDGSEICRVDNAFPPDGGWIGLYGFYPGKTFSDLRVWNARRPELVPLLEGGDLLYAGAHWEEAAVRYRDARRAHAGSALAEEAAVKQGVATMRLALATPDRRVALLAEADRVWSELRDPGAQRRAALARCQLLALDLSLDQALADLDSLAGREPTLTAELARLWARLAENRRLQATPAQADALAECWRRRFAGELATYEAATGLLLQLGHADEALTRCGGWFRSALWATAALGRMHELLQPRSPHFQSYSAAMLACGEYLNLAMDHLAVPEARIAAWTRLGEPARADELALLQGEAPDAPAALRRRRDVAATLARGDLRAADRAWALLASGRATEVAQAWQVGAVPPMTAVPALAEAGGLEGILARPWAAEEQHWALSILQLRARIAGDTAAEAAHAAARAALPYDHRWTHAWFPHHILGPFLRRLAGETQELDTAALTRLAEDNRWQHAQRVWWSARYLAGEVDDDAFLAGLPDVRERHPLLLLLRAMRHELAGRRGQAQADWRAWLAVPAVERLGEDDLPDPLLQLLAAWRADSLN